MVNTNEKFREIYEKYKNLILKIAYDITKDYHLSQDICQKTFEKLYGYQNHVKPGITAEKAETTAYSSAERQSWTT